MKVDAGTGEEVEGEGIVKGYQVSKGHYIEITDEDLEAVAVESTRTIDIDEFVPREEIDDLYIAFQAEVVKAIEADADADLKAADAAEAKALKRSARSCSAETIHGGPLKRRPSFSRQHVRIMSRRRSVRRSSRDIG